MAALSAPAAHACGWIGGCTGSNGNGSYTVRVNLSGTGLGSGGSLPGAKPGAASGYVPSPCWMDTAFTEQEIYDYYKGSQEDFKKAAADAWAKADAHGEDDNGPYGKGWDQGVLDHWGQQGTWYSASCKGDVNTDDYTQFLAKNPPQFVLPGGARPDARWVPPQVLLDAAWGAMTLPTPTLGHSPTGNTTYVNFDTFAWMTNPNPIGARYVEAELGGVVARVDANYTGDTFSTDDGGSASNCGASEAAHCVLRFHQVGDSRTITARVNWHAHGHVNGAPDMDDNATMVGNVNMQVQQIQTVNGGN
jgi:hypothetical protein